MIQRLASFLLLVCAWLLWSGNYTLDALPLGSDHKIALFGIFSCLAVTLIAVRIDKITEDRETYGMSWRPLLYIPWLLWQIVKSNLEIARIVLSPKLPISPRLIRIKVSQKTELGRAIYANSITLTPGTITLDTRGDHFVVHALTADTAAGVKTGEMDRKVRALEGGP